MSVQMTIRVEDELAAFVDETVRAGHGSRADVVNRALRHEVRRRAALRDAQIYVATLDPDLDSDAYLEWITGNVQAVTSEVDS